MQRTTPFAGVASLAVVLALGTAAAPAQAQIQVATAGPITGEYASFGKQMKDGAEMAVADITASVACSASNWC